MRVFGISQCLVQRRLLIRIPLYEIQKSVRCKGEKKTWEPDKEGFSIEGPGGECSPMLVRVWVSSELMKPTGSTANFSWNHLSGLANLPRLLSLSPPFKISLQSVTAPGGDCGNRRVFRAQLICGAASGFDLCHTFGYCLSLNEPPASTD